MGVLDWVKAVLQSDISEGLLVVVLFIVLLLGVLYGIVKLIEILKKVLNNSSETSSTDVKEKLQKLDESVVKLSEKIAKLEHVNESLTTYHNNISDNIKRLTESVDDFKDTRAEDLKLLSRINTDLESLMDETRHQNSEISRQVQQLQRDLASLHGTIIGMGTNRTRLK